MSKYEEFQEWLNQCPVKVIDYQDFSDQFQITFDVPLEENFNDIYEGYWFYYTSYYADYIKNNNLNYDFIFGPAYKGITLCSSICQSLYSKYSIISQYAFNRKETKLHGDKGNFVGCDIKGESLIVDDVISSGSSIMESYNLILESHATCENILVAFNRMEIG